MDFKFDRSKPYYPYVINYIITQHGLLELISRNFYTEVKNSSFAKENLNGFIMAQGVKNTKQEQFIIDIVTKNLQPTILIGEMSLKSEQRQNSTNISVNEIAKDIVDNHPYLLPFQAKAAGILLIMSFETTKKYDAKDEIWNFFYHCRNAAAHGGIFNITNLKRFPAKWGNLEIKSSDNGTNLFKDGMNPGLISIGDPLYLLYDIEQAYIN